MAVRSTKAAATAPRSSPSWSVAPRLAMTIENSPRAIKAVPARALPARPTPALPAATQPLPRTAPEVPVLIGAAAFLLIIGFLMFWTGGFGDDR